jgi:hypothetical protein
MDVRQRGESDKAKPFVKRGRKATGLYNTKTAGLLKDILSAARLFYFSHIAELY